MTTKVNLKESGSLQTRLVAQYIYNFFDSKIKRNLSVSVNLVDSSEQPKCLYLINLTGTGQSGSPIVEVVFLQDNPVHSTKYYEVSKEKLLDICKGVFLLVYTENYGLQDASLSVGCQADDEISFSCRFENFFRKNIN